MIGASQLLSCIPVDRQKEYQELMAEEDGDQIVDFLRIQFNRLRFPAPISVEKRDEELIVVFPEEQLFVLTPTSQYANLMASGKALSEWNE
jgi:hypothetical protein